VKPTPFTGTPDVTDDTVYTDEHIEYLRRQIGADIYAPGPTQVMVGSDNEPDIFAHNFPMLQAGSGQRLYATNGVQIGRRVTGAEFVQRFLTFATRVRQIAPNAVIVGPDHYQLDGWTTWQSSMPRHSSHGTWYMDEFLTAMKDESEARGVRLLDAWDFHWYPQGRFGGVVMWALNNATRTMTDTEIDAVVQGPRSYWDETYDERSWLTIQHLHGPAVVLTRLQDRIAQYYPGTELGVTEYFTGGCAHVASGLAVADSLGVFARMGVKMAAMWPVANCGLQFAYGGFRLFRNYDGNGATFPATYVRVEHPERSESSVHAGSDTPDRLFVLVINKTNRVRTFGVRAFHAAALASVDAWRIDATHASPFRASSQALTKNNAYAYAAPAMSATLLVFKTP